MLFIHKMFLLSVIWHWPMNKYARQNCHMPMHGQIIVFLDPIALWRYGLKLLLLHLCRTHGIAKGFRSKEGIEVATGYSYRTLQNSCHVTSRWPSCPLPIYLPNLKRINMLRCVYIALGPILDLRTWSLCHVNQMYMCAHSSNQSWNTPSFTSEVNGFLCRILVSCLSKCNNVKYWNVLL